jgi:hypothetical protein
MSRTALEACILERRTGHRILHCQQMIAWLLAQVTKDSVAPVGLALVKPIAEDLYNYPPFAEILAAGGVDLPKKEDWLPGTEALPQYLETFAEDAEAAMLALVPQEVVAQPGSVPVLQRATTVFFNTQKTYRVAQTARGHFSAWRTPTCWWFE